MAARSVGASGAQPLLPALTGIRGLAAWWVVLYHFREAIPAAGWPVIVAVSGRGYMAVDLFFVLSGFIITMNYADRFKTFSGRGYLAFLALRLGRIYPLHLFMLLIFLVNPLAIAVWSTAHQPGARYEAGYFGMSLLLVQNWGFAKALAWNVPAWSISTEWFAYLVFPLIAWLRRLTATRIQTAAAIMVAAALLAAASLATGDDIARFGLPRCLLEFYAGSCVQMIWRQRPRPAPALPGWLSGWLTVSSLGLIAGALLLPLPVFATALPGWCLLVYVLADNTATLSRLLSLRWVVVVGECSYATYLVHYFVRDWIKLTLVGRDVPWSVDMALYLGITACCSPLLYRFIEVPGRNAVRQLVGRQARVKAGYV